MPVAVVVESERPSNNVLLGFYRRNKGTHTIRPSDVPESSVRRSCFS